LFWHGEVLMGEDRSIFFGGFEITHHHPGDAHESVGTTRRNHVASHQTIEGFEGILKPAGTLKAEGSIDELVHHVAAGGLGAHVAGAKDGVLVEDQRAATAVGPDGLMAAAIGERSFGLIGVHERSLLWLWNVGDEALGRLGKKTPFWGWAVQKLLKRWQIRFSLGTKSSEGVENKGRGFFRRLARGRN
jgi:hypothetical protein